MDLFTGYTILQTLQKGLKTTVYRAQHNATGDPVIIKALTNEYPTEKEIEELNAEYTLVSSINSQHNVSALQFYNDSYRFGIVFEDFQGDSLETYIDAHPITLTEFFSLAKKIITALADVHQKHIIHKDLKPSNILYNPTSDRLKLSDFGIAQHVNTKEHLLISSEGLEGTLTYISPEQTGRMNRQIDFRSDIYSLGITFYQMLSGRLPFVSQHTMELIHSHIAKKATPLYMLDKTIPKAVSNIVMKMIEKMPENRYQGLIGLKKDIELCERSWKRSQFIAPFELGEFDATEYFTLSQTLYHRTYDLEHLLHLFNQSLEKRTEFALVTGAKGIGKSALVKELNQTISSTNTFFAEGLFSEENKKRPFFGFFQAFRHLIQQILAEDTSSLNRWKTIITKALGDNAELLIDVLPELKKIIGEQPIVEDLTPLETKLRFKNVIVQFLHIFSSENRSLVLFLDDLHLADTESLKLLRKLMFDDEMYSLFIVGTYTNSEVKTDHPLLQIANEIRLKKSIKTLELEPLTVDEVTQFIADSFSTTQVKSDLFAQLIFKKTDGNPLQIHSLLEQLYENGHIYFDRVEIKWSWDLSAVQTIGISSRGVSELLALIADLSEEDLYILQSASVLGQRFSPTLLAELLQTQDAKKRLHHLYELGFFTSTSAKRSSDLPKILEFQSESVYKNVYERFTSASSIHYKFGTYLYKEQQENALFHLNKGATHIQNMDEKINLIQLNISSAKSLLNDNALESAEQHLSIAESLLDEEDAWEKAYRPWFNLFTLKCTFLYKAGRVKEAESVHEMLVEKAKSAYERATLYHIRTVQKTLDGHMLDAIQHGIEGLKELGISLSISPSQLSLSKEQAALKLKLRKFDYQKLLHLPDLTDNEKKLCYLFLADLITPVYITGKLPLFQMITYKLLTLSVKHGYSEETSFACICYGLIQSHMYGNLREGHEYGQTGIMLLERSSDTTLHARIHFFSSIFIDAWNLHWKQLSEKLLKSIESRTGSLMYSSLACIHYILWNPALTVTRALEHVQKYTPLVQASNKQSAINGLSIVNHYLLALSGKTRVPTSFDTPQLNELELLVRIEKGDDYTRIVHFHLYKLILSYHFHHIDEAETHFKEIQNYSESILGTPWMIEASFYSFMFLAKTHKPLANSHYLYLLNNELEKMTMWATHCPENTQHLLLLMQGEYARLEERGADAHMFYKNALESAKENGFLKFEALANELMGLFYFEDGNEEIASYFFKASLSCYQKWGAYAKVESLVSSYSFLSESDTLITGQTTYSTTTKNTSASLDIHSIMKASQTISSEIKLDMMLKKVLHVVIENAGAERGVLFMHKEGSLFLEAEGMAGKDAILHPSTPIRGTDEGHPFAVSVLLYVSRALEHIVLDDASLDPKFSRDSYILKTKAKSILSVPLIKQNQLIAILYLENNLLSGAFTSDRIELLTMLSSEIAISIENAQLYQNLVESLEHQKKLTHAYSRFVPNQFLSLLNKHSIIDIHLGDQIEQEMTVFFSDIRDFTSLSEKMSPQDNINFINSYLKRMEPIIGRYNGFIDKYIGDAIMGLFPTNADDAVKSSIAMLMELNELNSKRIEYDWEPIRIGIGLNTGDLMLGTVGGEHRIEGTVISDAVNLASRTESLTKFYGVELLITEFTNEHLENEYHIRVIDRIRVKGKQEAVTLYEVFDADEEETRLKKQALLPTYNLAYELFHSSRYEEAHAQFVQVYRQFPEDKATKIYIQRCRKHQPSLHPKK